MTRAERITAQQQIWAILEGEGSSLRTTTGVVGVGVGCSRVAATLDNPVIRVYVNSLEDLTAPLPTAVGGFAVEVSEDDPTDIPTCTPAEGSRPDNKNYDQLVGGIKITNNLATGLGSGPGTLGCMAWFTNPADANDPNNGWVMLSCEHVLNDGELWSEEQINDPGLPRAEVKIGQPEYRKCFCECNVVGKMIAANKSLDCAIAKPITEDAPLNTIQDVEEGIKGVGTLVDGVFCITTMDRVFKRGAMTGLTFGIVDYLEISSKSFMVRMIDGACFNKQGDSGAVVLNESNEVVGMIFGGSQSGLPTINPYTGDPIFEVVGDAWCTPIHAIQEALNIEIKASTEADLGIEGVGNYGAKGGRKKHRRITRPAQNAQTTRIEPEKALLAQFPSLQPVWEMHRDEILHLIDHERSVKVAWHRNRGPEFVGAIWAAERAPHRNLKAALAALPAERLLLQMAASLQLAGSKALRNTISTHLHEVMETLQQFTRPEPANEKA